jgi:hypothetical protein
MKKASSEQIRKAEKLGREDGATTAREALEDGSYKRGSSSDWDSGLINALGNRRTRELFGLKGDKSPSDDPVYSELLGAYTDAAKKAWDAAG